MYKSTLRDMAKTPSRECDDGLSTVHRSPIAALMGHAPQTNNDVYKKKPGQTSRPNEELPPFSSFSRHFSPPPPSFPFHRRNFNDFSNRDRVSSINTFREIGCCRVTQQRKESDSFYDVVLVLKIELLLLLRLLLPHMCVYSVYIPV